MSHSPANSTRGYRLGGGGHNAAYDRLSAAQLQQEALEKEKQFQRRSSSARRNYEKQHTEVGKTMSFAPSDILQARRMMCCRRGEHGSEKCLSQGRSAFETSPTRSKQQQQSTGPFRSASGGGNGPSWGENEQMAALNPIDAPSPLDHFFVSPVRELPPSKEELELKRLAKKSSDDDGNGDDDNANRANDSGSDVDSDEDPFETIPHSIALPDWRVLLGKDLYAKEKEQEQIIKERYAVATNPPKEKTRRRSTISGNVLSSSTRR